LSHCQRQSLEHNHRLECCLSRQVVWELKQRPLHRIRLMAKLVWLADIPLVPAAITETARTAMHEAFENSVPVILDAAAGAETRLACVTRVGAAMYGGAGLAAPAAGERLFA
jgi:hypothetical protein